MSAPDSTPRDMIGYGRLPLAFSARCFTARTHKLLKDDCQLRCADYADGMLLKTQDDKPFLSMNGIQTLSAASCNLIEALPEMSSRGVDVVRLSPQSRHMGAVVEALVAGKAVGWFQGRMEFGPRALGSRSILGDARSPAMQKTLNLKVKYRESFRPFAPSVLAEDVGEWFELERESPYMLQVADVRPAHRRAMTIEETSLFGIDKLNVPRSDIPAVTHVDYSARIQTVHRETNPRYHALLSAFKARTGCPVLVNTSFNVRGEPIVCTPEDAFRCFMGTGIEVLAAGNCLLKKEAQDSSLKLDYKDAFELD